MAPPDPILSLSVNYKKDCFPQKVNLGIGAYRDENGKPYVFPVVRKAQQLILNDPKIDMEYTSIEGDINFNKAVRGVLLGWDHPDVTSGRIASAQTLSGTGALRILSEFFFKFRPAPIYISSPTWGNHPSIFKATGLHVRQYRYFRPETKGLDIEGMLEDLKNATPGSIVLLHSCAHNPSGVDPTLDQWKKIAEVCHENKLYPYFDSAYQGFVSGNLDKDGIGLRYFVDQGFDLCVAQSFAKIMGLYGERTGALHFVCKDKAIAEKVLSQVKILIRVSYSSPPRHGSQICSLILNNLEMRQQWLSELITVTQRINEMRNLLRKELESIDAPGDWSHVTTQIGMFSFTGLSPAQSDLMVKKHHIYMTKDGRISICGLTRDNIPYVARCIKDVLQNH